MQRSRRRGVTYCADPALADTKGPCLGPRVLNSRVWGLTLQPTTTIAMIQALLQVSPECTAEVHVRVLTQCSAWAAGSTGRSSHGSASSSASISQNSPSKTGFSTASTAFYNALLSPRLSTRKSNGKRLTNLRYQITPRHIGGCTFSLHVWFTGIRSRKSEIQLHLGSLQPGQIHCYPLLQPVPVRLGRRRLRRRSLCARPLLRRNHSVALVHVHAGLD